MSFFECDRCGGAIGLFCHCPPPAPAGNPALGAIHDANRETEKALQTIEAEVGSVRRTIDNLYATSAPERYQDSLDRLRMLSEHLNKTLARYEGVVGPHVKKAGCRG